MIRATKYLGLMLVDDANMEGLFNTVNPALGPILGAAININDTYSTIHIGRAENFTDLSFFRKRYVLQRVDYVDPISRPVSHGRSQSVYPPMTIWIPAGGKGSSTGGTLSASFGEFFERFYGAFSFMEKGEETAFGSRAELIAKGYQVLGPQDITFFHESQYVEDFPYRRFTDDARLSWVSYLDAVHQTEVLVPAQLTYLTRFIKREEHAVTYSTTGGLAFDSTFGSAFEHGLLEYIERDAVNLAWISRVPSKRIEVDVQEVKEKLAKLGGLITKDAHFVQLPTRVEGVFVIGAFGHYQALFIAGAGADLSFDAALFKAVGELMQCYDSLRDMVMSPSQHTQQGDLRKEDLYEFSLILQYYSNPARMMFVNQWIEAMDEVRVSELEEQVKVSNIDELVVAMDEKGYRVLYKDLLIERFVPPFRGKLVRVFVPSLIPAHVPNMPFLGHKSYYMTPVELGASEKPLGFERLNLDEPVPLP